MKKWTLFHPLYNFGVDFQFIRLTALYAKHLAVKKFMINYQQRNLKPDISICSGLRILILKFRKPKIIILSSIIQPGKYKFTGKNSIHSDSSDLSSS